MDGERNGTQAQQQDTQQEQGQQQATQQSQQEAQGAHSAADGSTAISVDAQAYEAQLAERDSRIAELEGQVAEAAKSAEAADGLRAEIAALKEQGESDRIDFKLQLAGCRSVKAARAVLEDHGGDIDALKEAEPWLFAKHAGQDAGGKTGLPNAGAASDSGKTLKHWREIAGLTDDDKKE